MSYKNRIDLHLSIEPLAVQSARFCRSGNFIRSYQPSKIIKWKALARYLAMLDLPTGFAMYDSNIPLRVEVDLLFPPLKSMSKKIKTKIAQGDIIYKITKPDLGDNLLKGLFDSLTNLVWVDDSQICEVSSRKRYGNTGEIRISVIPLE